MAEQRTLILASSSPRRQQLIHTLRFPVKVMTSRTDESIPGTMNPANIVQTLALRKARSVYSQLQNEEGIVVGADTIVAIDHTVLGKPKDSDDALRMLTLLQGKTHQVYSGVACIDTRTAQELVDFRMTHVTIKPLNLRQIENYVRSGEPLDKAGAYAIQGLGSVLVDSIHGDYFNVVGLPLSLLSDMLEKCGVHVL